MRCSEACAATARVAVDRRLARKLGLGRDRVVATGSARLDGAGRTYAFVRADRSARKALERAGAVAAKLETKVVDGAGNSVRLIASRSSFVPDDTRICR